MIRTTWSPTTNAHEGVRVRDGDALHEAQRPGDLCDLRRRDRDDGARGAPPMKLDPRLGAKDLTLTMNCEACGGSVTLVFGYDEDANQTVWFHHEGCAHPKVSLMFLA